MKGKFHDQKFFHQSVSVRLDMISAQSVTLMSSTTVMLPAADCRAVASASLRSFLFILIV